MTRNDVRDDRETNRGRCARDATIIARQCAEVGFGALAVYQASSVRYPLSSMRATLYPARIERPLAGTIATVGSVEESLKRRGALGVRKQKTVTKHRRSHFGVSRQHSERTDKSLNGARSQHNTACYARRSVDKKQ